MTNLPVYNNNALLKAAGVPIQFTEEQIQEYVKCSRDPLYFIKNYVKIVSLDDGIVPFVPFSYQERIISAMHENKNTLAKCFRQSGKSTTVAAYFAWYILFNDNKTAAILANKQAIAIEIFARIQFIIENLPKWLQQGVVEWNKKSLMLENGSRCIAAATSASAIRGMSINILLCVDGSSEITLRNRKTGEIKRVQIQQLENMEGINILDNTRKMFDIDFSLSELRHEWEVLTDTGWSKFTGLKITETNRSIEVKFTNTSLICSFGHKIMTKTGWIEAQDLTVEDFCQTSSGFKQVLNVRIINENKKLYDLIGVENGSRYYTNDILSHNCDEFSHLKPNLADEFIASVFPTLSSSESSKLIIVSTPSGLNHYHKLWVDAINGNNDFVTVEGNWQENPKRTKEWAEEQRKKLGDVKFFQEIECQFLGSSYTLIDGSKLATIPFANPIFNKDNLEIFSSPEKNRSYVITVDVSRGRHMDYSAFSVIDVTNMPYSVIATFKDNTISTLEFPHIIYNIARQYNNAFILIEINDLGESVSNTIWHEYEYENMYFTKGNELSEVRGYPGVRTTSKVKSLGCSILKDLIEHDQLIVNSYKIIEELGIFALHRKSYAAQDPVINDDLCTTLWLFAWLTKQNIFQEVTSNDLRKILTERKQAYIDELMTPFGFYQDNRPDDMMSHTKLPNKNSPLHLTQEQIELLNF